MYEKQHVTSSFKRGHNNPSMLVNLSFRILQLQGYGIFFQKQR